MFIFFLLVRCWFSWFETAFFLPRHPYALNEDFLGGLGGAWSPQKVTAWSAKEGAQQYVEAQLGPGE